jgi:hypothetical protein
MSIGFATMKMHLTQHSCGYLALTPEHSHGFVNRRSGVQSPQPAPRKTASNQHYSRFSVIGIDGKGGAGLRFLQPQKPEQLFTRRSSAGRRG